MKPVGFGLWTLLAILAAAGDAQAQATVLNCGAYGGGSALPPECMLARSARSSSSTTQIDINAVEKASYAKPVPTSFPRGAPSFISYDLKFDNLCGPNGVNSIASDWVGPKRASIDLFGHDRTVAMAAVVSFPSAKKDETKQVKIPLVVKANFGDPNVQNCDGTIITDVPANHRVNLHFEFKKRSVLQFKDQTKLIAGITKIAQGGGALVAYGGGNVFAPAVTSVFVSFLEKNTEPVKNITAGMNEILSAFADESNPDPMQYPLDANSIKHTHQSNSRAVFSVTKTGRISRMAVQPGRGWPPVGTDFSGAFGNIQPLFTNAQTAVDSPWSANLVKFCDKLRLQINSVTVGDRIGTALGIGYHSFVNLTEYKPGKTCLNRWEIATLKELGYAAPFEDAWNVVVAQAAPRRFALISASKRAFVERAKVSRKHSERSYRRWSGAAVKRQKVAAR